MTLPLRSESLIGQLRGPLGHRAKFEEWMAPRVRYVLLERVVDAKPQAQEDADRRPETWPQDETEHDSKQSRSRVWRERPFQDHPCLVRCELHRLDRQAATVRIREGHLAVRPQVGDPAGLAVGRLHVPTSVELEQAQRYRSHPAGPATAHREEHVRGTRWEAGRDEPASERVDQAKESPRHPVPKVQPPRNEMITHDENTNQPRPGVTVIPAGKDVTTRALRPCFSCEHLDRHHDVTRRDWLAAEFERHREHLRSVAYRMLGSVSEAEDAVQEAWLRLDRSDPGGSDDLRGWLTVVVGRICLDGLRRRKARREQLGGSWLPEPIIGGEESSDPERNQDLADSVGLALLVVLESLTPRERLAFVLHDVFGMPFDQIATVVDRSPAATRQLASRARRRVRAEAPPPDADVAVQREVVDAFLTAARDGDFEALLQVLDPGVVVRIDGGPKAPRPLARPPIVGAEAVMQEMKRFRAGAGARVEPVMVNGAPGLVLHYPARSILGAFTVANGRILEINLIADPDKLRGLPST